MTEQYEIIQLRFSRRAYNELKLWAGTNNLTDDEISKYVENALIKQLTLDKYGDLNEKIVKNDPNREPNRDPNREPIPDISEPINEQINEQINGEISEDVSEDVNEDVNKKVIKRKVYKIN